MVIGAGPIGVVTALAALAGGCSQVVLTDVQQPKLDLATKLGPIRPVNVAKENLRQVIDELTEGWGADLVFEATGAPAAIQKGKAIDRFQTALVTKIIFDVKREQRLQEHERDFS